MPQVLARGGVSPPTRGAGPGDCAEECGRRIPPGTGPPAARAGAFRPGRAGSGRRLTGGRAGSGAGLRPEHGIAAAVVRDHGLGQPLRRRQRRRRADHPAPPRRHRPPRPRRRRRRRGRLQGRCGGHVQLDRCWPGRAVPGRAVPCRAVPCRAVPGCRRPNTSSLLPPLPQRSTHCTHHPQCALPAAAAAAAAAAAGNLRPVSYSAPLARARAALTPAALHSIQVARRPQPTRPAAAGVCARAS